MKGRRIFLLGAFVVWVMILAFIVISALNSLSVPPWGNFSGDDRSAEVAGPVQIGQQFVAPYPGLYRIELTLDPASVQSSQPVTFRLDSQSQSSSPLAVDQFYTGDLLAGVPHGIEFPPIRDSAGNTLTFSLDSPQSTPGNAVTAHYDPDSALDGASATLNGEPVSGNLKFRTFYSLRTRDKLGLLLEKMAAGRPYFLGSKSFYAGLAGAYLIVLGIFVWYIAQSILEDE